MATFADMVLLLSNPKYAKVKEIAPIASINHLDCNLSQAHPLPPCVEENEENMENLGKCPRFQIAFTEVPTRKSLDEIQYKRRETFIDTFFDLPEYQLCKANFFYNTRTFDNGDLVHVLKYETHLKKDGSFVYQVKIQSEAETYLNEVFSFEMLPHRVLCVITTTRYYISDSFWVDFCSDGERFYCCGAYLSLNQVKLEFKPNPIRACSKFMAFVPDHVVQQMNASTEEVELRKRTLSIISTKQFNSDVFDYDESDSEEDCY